MKKLASVTSAVLSALLLAGCAGGPAGTTTGGGGKKGDTLSYAVWGSTDELALIDDIIAGFEAFYADEGYKIDLRVYANDYYTNLQNTFSGKNEADVFWMQGGTINGYMRAGLLLDLQPYIEKTYDDGITLTEDDLWSINDSYRYDADTDTLGTGDLYALVKDWSPDFAMVYNKTLIDEFDAEEGTYPTSVKQQAEDKLAAIDANDPQYASLKGTKVVGRTLADIVGYPTDESGKYPSQYIPMSWQQNELMCFLLTTYGSTGIRETYGTILDSDPLKFAQMQTEMCGEKIYTEDGKAFNYSSQKQSETMKKAYQHFINYQKGALASTGVFGVSSVSSDADFPKGNCAVAWYGRWKFTTPSWAKVNFGLAPPPTEHGGVDADGDGYDDNEDVYCSSVAIGYAVSARTKKPELAWKFIRYCMTAGMNSTLSKCFNLPGNRTIARSEKFLNPASERDATLNKWYVWLADYTHPFTFTKWVDNSVADKHLKTYLTAATKDMSLDEALRTAGNAINQEITASLN